VAVEQTVIVSTEVEGEAPKLEVESEENI